MPKSKSSRVKQKKQNQNKQKKGKVLWANPYCMLDTSSGASVSIRQILTQLKSVGFEVEIVGGTIFDDRNGTEGISEIWKQIQNLDEKVVNIEDNGLTYRTVITKSTNRQDLSLEEANDILMLYLTRLDQFKPDLVFLYGGSMLEFLIAQEARIRGIPSVAYLVNANYKGTRWCRDIDLIVTDTCATSNYYTTNFGFTPKPLGKFIDPGKVISKSHTRSMLTFINPCYEKGAGIVAQIAVVLAKKRPDIKIEIIESRGNWPQILKDVTKGFFKNEIEQLPNVTLTPNTKNISEVYERSRVLLAPSVWWESGSRVLAEAMLNGIPSIVTNNGGSPEMVADGGFVLDLPTQCYDTPYNNLPSMTKINQFVDLIERLWDDEKFYLHTVAKALLVGAKNHTLRKATQKLEDTFIDLINEHKPRQDRDKLILENHKHKLQEETISFGHEKDQS